MAAITVERLTKRYGQTIAVDDLSLDIEEGEIFGILGRNGAGKTTTVEMIAGLRRPDQGTIELLGLDPWRDRAVVRQLLGVQLQRAALHGALTVSELVTMFRSFYRAGREPDALIARLGLTEQRTTAFDKLSGGQQQRLSIALALIGSPRVVILDELTTGLDPEARRNIWTMIEQVRDEGATIVLVSHAMEEVERLCDRVAIIDRGKVIAQDTPSRLAAMTGDAQQVSFRLVKDGDITWLSELAEVEAVVREGTHVTVTGHGDLLQTVSVALVDHGIVATDTRAHTPSLDDAFLTLTGRPFDEGDHR